MTRKVTVRIDMDLYFDLKEECKKYGYRSLNAFICKLLKERKVVEIAGGHELATAIHQIKTLTTNDLRVRERSKELCQSFDSLTIEIEELRNCVKSCVTQHEEEQ